MFNNLFIFLNVFMR